MNAFIINATVSFLASLVLHELGHYIAARMCAVPVRRMGRTVCARKMSSGKADLFLFLETAGAASRADSSNKPETRRNI